MIPRRRKPERMNVRESSVIRCPSHLKFVRGFSCSALGRCDHECSGKIEAHHVRAGGNGGVGLKPDDSRCVPLCSAAHKELHDKGHETFETKYKLDLAAIAHRLWQISPAGMRYRAEHDG